VKAPATAISTALANAQKLSFMAHLFAGGTSGQDLQLSESFQQC
jgi:hypothetical protein